MIEEKLNEICQTCERKYDCWTSREVEEIFKVVTRIRTNVDSVDKKPFSHNLISLALASAYNKCGHKMPNWLIDEFGLEDLGWEKQFD